MLNYLWLGMIVLSVIVGALSGKSEAVSNAFIEQGKNAVMLAIGLGGMFTLMLGMMRLVEQSGLISVFARLFRPLLRRLFPDVPPDHPAMGAMMMNMAANLVGAGNAATPLGLRAMAQLNKLNPHPGTATNAMCTFLVINTAALTLISPTALLILKNGGSANPSVIIGPAIFATLFGLIVGVLVAKMLEKLPLFALRAPAAAVAATGATVEPKEVAGAAVAEEKEFALPEPKKLRLWAWALLVVYALIIIAGLALSMDKAGFGAAWQAQDGGLLLQAVMGGLSALVLPACLGFFVLYAAVAGLNVFEEFVEGAKEGMQTVFRIIPYLVGMIVGVGVLRASGVIDGMAAFMKNVLRIPGALPDLMPMILMRPLSGSGSQAVLEDTVQKFGADSYQALTAAAMYGSTETTIYVLAVYFGAVGIRRGRHSLLAGLISDAASMAGALFLCQWLMR